MPITVKVGHAKTHLSDLLARVEAGQDVIIARGNVPIAKLTRIQGTADRARAIADILTARGKRTETTVAELLALRDEGRHI